MKNLNKNVVASLTAVSVLAGCATHTNTPKTNEKNTTFINAVKDYVNSKNDFIKGIMDIDGVARNAKDTYFGNNDKGTDIAVKEAKISMDAKVDVRLVKDGGELKIIPSNNQVLPEAVKKEIISILETIDILDIISISYHGNDTVILNEKSGKITVRKITCSASAKSPVDCTVKPIDAPLAVAPTPNASTTPAPTPTPSASVVPTPAPTATPNVFPSKSIENKISGYKDYTDSTTNLRAKINFEYNSKIIKDIRIDANTNSDKVTIVIEYINSADAARALAYKTNTKTTISANVTALNSTIVTIDLNGNKSDLIETKLEVTLGNNDMQTASITFNGEKK